MYIKSSRNTLPRPLMAHLPWKDYSSFEYLGNVEGLPSGAHFAQQNSIEYDSALEWRQKDVVHNHTKQSCRTRHIEELAAVMHVMEVFNPRSPSSLHNC